MAGGLLKSLNFLGRGAGQVETPAEAESRVARRALRHNVTGTSMTLVVDSNPFTIHVKDLSASGLCGLTDAPLAVHQVVRLYLTKTDPVAIQIRWIRRALIGAAFMQGVSDEMMEELLRLYKRKE